jgi:hypothetical protein
MRAQVHRRCTESLPREERELRESALYIIANLQLLGHALRLCDFKDVAVAVEAKHVRAAVESWCYNASLQHPFTSHACMRAGAGRGAGQGKGGDGVPHAGAV